ncbi:MAG: YgeY family selenium metabolism-linked hydrolase [Acetivibrionales bacterium]|jgi:putative selenium metabolism hydrolase
MYNASNVAKEIELIKPDMIDFASRLIQTPSETGCEGPVSEIIKAEMEKLGFDEVFKDRVGNVVGIIKGDGTGDNIMFNCHMDQVGTGSLADWEYPPFDGVVADGYIHGRGASDTKGAMACQIYGAYLVKKMGIKLKGDIILTFVVEEEPGDMWGMKMLCDEWLDRPVALVVLGEATGLDIYLGHRGKLEAQLVSRGRMCHSSAPWLGVNAVSNMLPVLTEIEKLKHNLPDDKNLGKGSQAIIHISCQPGSCCAVPDICTVNIDRRYVPSENADDIISEMKCIVEKLKAVNPDIDVSVEIRKLHHKSYTGVEADCLLDKPAYWIDENNAYVQKVTKALNSIGQTPEYKCWNFGTDGAYMARVLGIPTIGYSCCEEIYAHRPNDRVKIEFMEKAVEGNIAIIKEVAG